MLVVAPVVQARRCPPSPGDSELWGIDRLNIPRSDIPAVTHLDYSARIQTVTAERSPVYHLLIEEFNRLTGCPVLVNTSFNVRGEPIVCTPEDAYRCFMRTGLDHLIIGSFAVAKSDQPMSDAEAWQQSIPPD